MGDMVDEIIKANPGSKRKEIMTDKNGRVTKDENEAVKGRVYVLKDGRILAEFTWYK